MRSVGLRAGRQATGRTGSVYVTFWNWRRGTSTTTSGSAAIALNSDLAPIELYTADARVVGWIAADGRRVTDLLNESDQLRLWRPTPGPIDEPGAATGKQPAKKAGSPVEVQVFAPRPGDEVGKGSLGFFVDLAIRYPSLASSGAGVSSPVAPRRTANAVASSCQSSSSVAAGADSRVGVVAGRTRQHRHRGRCHGPPSLPDVERCRRYEDDPETNAATSRISCSDSWSLNAGIGPPPFVTCRTTVSNEGARSSRLGPTVPLELASENVWQLPQPALAKTALPLVASPVSPPPVVVSPPVVVVVVVVVVSVVVAGGADESSSLPPQPVPTSASTATREPRATAYLAIHDTVPVRPGRKRRLVSGSSPR